MSELKPCPFCEGALEIVGGGPVWHKERSGFFNKCPIAHVGIDLDAWNRRPAPAMSEERIREIAREIAEKANECCHRSDGYERQMEDFAFTAINQALSSSPPGDLPPGGWDDACMHITNQTLAWAVERWNAEVKDRPLNNIHRRSLDDVWRQVMRKFGGDPDVLVGPSHDAMLAAIRSLKEGKQA